MKLLIVDDEKYICSSLKNGFDWQSMGFDEVLDAAKVSDALNLISNNVVDVIITDIKMPKLSGIDLIKEMSQLSPKTKIIIISGYDKFEYAQVALKYGVIDYLLKPAPIEDVVLAVQKAINSLSTNMPKQYKDVLRKDFLLNLIFGRIKSSEEMRRGIEEHELNVLKSDFFIAVFSGKEIVTNNIILDKIKQFLANNFSDCFFAFDDNRRHIVVFFNTQYSKKDIFEIFNSFCAYMNKDLEANDLQAVIGQKINDVLKIAEAYGEAAKIADKFIISGEEKVIFVDDINNVKAYNIVYMAKQFVEDNISKNITIETITDIIHITPNYFSSIFKKVTGDSFITYVNLRKIEKAKEILKAVDMPVSEVAEKCGFSDVKYFNRVFKKYTGVTPSEYKKQEIGL